MKEKKLALKEELQMDKMKDTILKIDKKIIKFKVYKKVVRSGTGGAISLPKQFVGKTVYVELMEEKK